MSDLREAARAASIALDDWLNTYASEMCDEVRVVEACDRINDHGGTLAYIADVQKALRAALAADAERVSGWQPIETCPDSCRGEYPKYVLFWNGHHTGVGFCYPSDDGDNKSVYVDETDEIISPNPTHWMPRPAPPVLASTEKEPKNG